MARQTILAEDGPLGKAGTLVWVNDEEQKADKAAPKKSAAKSKRD